MKIIDGKSLRDEILFKLKSEIETKKLQPNLAIIQIGDNQASNSYINQKLKSAKNIGAKVTLTNFPENISQVEIETKIKDLNQEKLVSGIIIQLPIAKHLNTDKLVGLISREKDVDGFRKDSLYQPPTPVAVLEILKKEKVSLQGKTVIIVGQGKLVGKPLGKILSKNKKIKELIQLDINSPKPLGFYTKKADILICATGQAKLIKKEMVKEGVVVIDAGISIDKNTGKLTGDVDFETVKNIAGKITPVPGGVGPMTVAALLQNLVKASNLK